MNYEQNKFLAALKGIKLDEAAAEEVDPVQRIKDRVAAQQQGITEDQYSWQQAGLGFEEEDEEE